MGAAKVITCISAQPSADPLVVAQELATELAAEGHRVIIIGDAAANDRVDPALWTSRVETLSPALLRNYLADPTRSYGALALTPWPQADQLKIILSLVIRSYDWIFVASPAEHSTETAALYDASDLLLWVRRSKQESGELWSLFLQKLTELHLPTSFAREVFFDVDTLKRRRVIQELARALSGGAFPYRIHTTRALEDGTASRVVEQIKNQVQPQLLQAFNPSPNKVNEGSPGTEAAIAQKTIEACLAAETTVGGSREERSQIVTRVLEDVLGLGPLEPLLKDPEITEILVNGFGCVYVEKKGKLYSSGTSFVSEGQLRTIIDRIVAPIGRRVDESSPLCDARLADGSRVNIVLPPLALDGAVITIRKFSAKKLDLDALIAFDSMSAEMAEFLRRSVRRRQNIIVSGGTGSGKTTLLNALSSAIPDDERIITIEDAAELRLQKPHVIRLESRPPNAEGQGLIPIRSLVMNALRMRPDRIVVGECRGGEALDMLQAMNTGHDGSLTTLHANSPRDAMGRLETLVLMAGVELPVRVVREQIRSAVNLIVQQARRPDGSRKVISIAEVTGMEGDTLTLQELYRYARGTFEATGLRSASTKPEELS